MRTEDSKGMSFKHGERPGPVQPVKDSVMDPPKQWETASGRGDTFRFTF